ncbi:hypothetical protein NON20_22235 [Synechocystis sp. B12]|uniref:hypothetical protein n=1 Tax=unclassified Synechocystis TaxID=2640012 RepID=UPI000AAADEF7|nr:MULTISPECIES: hypothetical protein [unclassified Synechocystis]WLT38194.1 hypothetical protein NON20_22235 [Synechocystis sp. B12]MBD2619751.1 hypothetical protein [Synechocystis sp. FACHB-898]MBD2638526.1 hypothetical protein [Synechocystis sp. FACHB-908]MBD2662492.1 hypothetical protein [Synechocystis sp. FACHB-929]MCW5242343.1 hypothetical protein [Synechocystis sp. PCC 6803]
MDHPHTCLCCCHCLLRHLHQGNLVWYCCQCRQMQAIANDGISPLSFNTSELLNQALLNG